jgi:ABC-type branched-subunit amino acid transport system substrate-binding protein
VALLLPLSGAAGAMDVAKGLKQAGELALIEYDNPNILLISKDTLGTAEGARKAADEAMAAGAEVILGPLFAHEVTAVSAAASARNVPVIAFSSDQTVAGRGTYLLSFLAGKEIPRVVDYAGRQGRKSFAALVPAGAYGKLVESELRAVASRQGARVTAVQAYTTAGGMNEPVKRVREAMQSAAHSGAPVDTLLVAAGGDMLPTLAPLLASNDIDTRAVKLIGTMAWDYADIGREPALVGGWFPAPEAKGWSEFAQRYSKTYGSQPPRLASLAYDAVSLTVSLASQPVGQRFTSANLTRPSGFAGVDGLFRLRTDGLIERGLAVLEVQPSGIRVLDPAPVAFPASAPSDATASAPAGARLSAN